MRLWEDKNSALLPDLLRRKGCAGAGRKNGIAVAVRVPTQLVPADSAHLENTSNRWIMRTCLRDIAP